MKWLKSLLHGKNESSITSRPAPSTPERPPVPVALPVEQPTKATAELSDDRTECKHEWFTGAPCLCSKCFKTFHQWSGNLCTKCGKVRDEGASSMTKDAHELVAKNVAATLIQSITSIDKVAPENAREFIANRIHHSVLYGDLVELETVRNASALSGAMISYYIRPELKALLLKHKTIAKELAAVVIQFLESECKLHGKSRADIVADLTMCAENGDAVLFRPEVCAALQPLYDHIPVVREYHELHPSRASDLLSAIAWTLRNEGKQTAYVVGRSARDHHICIGTKRTDNEKIDWGVRHGKRECTVADEISFLRRRAILAFEEAKGQEVSWPDFLEVTYPWDLDKC